MKVKARLAKSAILNRNGLNHLQIAILPPKPEQLGDKKPVCIVFALDRSGSMDDMAVESFVSYDGYPANQRINYIQQPMTPTMWPSSSAGTSNRTYFESGSFSHFKPIPAERSTKINYAQDAIIKFLDLLGPNDKIGIVSFDDIAFVEQEFTNISDQSVKRSVISNVRSISPRGCTNIVKNSKGWGEP